MKKRISGILSVIVAFLFCAGCGGGIGSSTALSAEAQKPKTVEKTYKLSQGDSVELLAHEVLGEVHDNEKLQYTSWKLSSRDLQSSFLTGYANDFNPQYFTGLDEKGLVHPEWSRTWGQSLNVPVNIDSGEYELNLVATNNSDPGESVNIKLKIIVNGQKQSVPFAISGQPDTPCSRDFFIIPNSDVFVGRVFVAANEKIYELPVNPVQGSSTMTKSNFPSKDACDAKGADLRVQYFVNHVCGDHMCPELKVAYYKY